MSVFTNSFRAFTSYDWQCFGGCESERPMIWEDGEGFTVVVDDKSVTVNWIDPCAEQLFVYMKDFAGPDSAAIVADKLVDLFKDMVDLTDLAVANVRRFSVLLVAIMGRELTTVELK